MEDFQKCVVRFVDLMLHYEMTLDEPGAEQTGHQLIDDFCGVFGDEHRVPMKVVMYGVRQACQNFARFRVEAFDLAIHENDPSYDGDGGSLEPAPVAS